MEEALIEMYRAGVSVRRVEDITEALRGSKVSAATISELNKKAYVNIEAWRNRPLHGGKYPYVYVDGIYLRWNWGGEHENVAVWAAITVNGDGYREVLGAGGDLQLAAGAGLDLFGYIHHAVVIEIQAGDGVVALGVPGFLLDGDDLAGLIKFHYAEALGIVEVVAEHGSTAAFLSVAHCGTQHMGKPVAAIP